MPAPAIKDLDDSLHEQGLAINPIATASAFLGLARHRGWVRAAPAEGMTWLGDLACEVLKSSKTASPLLDELLERLEQNRVAAEPRKVAAAILGIALDDGWHSDPLRMISWLERLAIDVVHSLPQKITPADNAPVLRG